MILLIWTRNDATGLLDDEYRDGDILRVVEDADELTLGQQEKKSWLAIKIPDPPNKSRVKGDLVKPEYGVSPTPEELVIRRACRYTLNWRTKFTASEIATIEDANAMLADGQTSVGGTVNAGVVSGLFTIADFLRK